MPLRFKCHVCQNDIFINYLKPGEVGICPSCGASNTVPDDAEQTDRIPDDYRSKKTRSHAREDASHLRKRLEQMYSGGIKKLGPLSTTLYIFLTLIVLLLASTATVEIIFFVQISSPNSLYYAKEILANASLIDILNSLWGVAFFVSSIFFLIWFYRAHKNLGRTEVPGLEHKSYWTVIGCLIPILNLVMPYIMLRETWKGSKILAGEIPAEKIYDISSDTKIKIWFAFTIIFGFLSMLTRLLINSEEFRVFQTGIQFWILGDLLYLVAGILLLLTIHQITDFQEKARKMALYASSMSPEMISPEGQSSGPDSSIKEM